MLLAPGRINSSFDFLRLFARQPNAEQQTIEKLVAAASPTQREVLRADAEAALTQINRRMAQRLLYHDEIKAAKRAIELLVCVEAIDHGKGWWFRTKRRAQLTQMYLEEALPLPLLADDTDDTAVKLMTLTDVALTKYMPMSEDELLAALPQDFPPDHYSLDLDAVTFVFPDMPDFYFTVSENEGSKSLCIIGRKQYAGFTLFVPARGHWHCSATQRASGYQDGGAQALAEMLEEKFGIRDISRGLDH